MLFTLVLSAGCYANYTISESVDTQSGFDSDTLVLLYLASETDLFGSKKDGNDSGDTSSLVANIKLMDAGGNDLYNATMEETSQSGLRRQRIPIFSHEYHFSKNDITMTGFAGTAIPTDSKTTGDNYNYGGSVYGIELQEGVYNITVYDSYGTEIGTFDIQVDKPGTDGAIISNVQGIQTELYNVVLKTESSDKGYFNSCYNPSLANCSYIEDWNGASDDQRKLFCDNADEIGGGSNIPNYGSCEDFGIDWVGKCTNLLEFYNYSAPAADWVTYFDANFSGYQDPEYFCQVKGGIYNKL